MLVDLPAASRANDRARCENWALGAAGTSVGRYSPLAGRLPAPSQKGQPRKSRLRLQCLRIVVPQIGLVVGHQLVQIGDNVVILRIDCRDDFGRVVRRIERLRRRPMQR